MGLLPSWERNVTGFYIVTRVIQHMWSPCVCASLQVSPTLCKLMGYSLPDSTVHGILQARILEWVAIPFSRRSSWVGDRTFISYISYLSWRGDSLPLAPPEKPQLMTLLLKMHLSQNRSPSLCDGLPDPSQSGHHNLTSSTALSLLLPVQPPGPPCCS